MGGPKGLCAMDDQTDANLNRVEAFVWEVDSDVGADVEVGV